MLEKRHIPNLLTFARVGAVPLALAVILINPLCTKLLFWIFLLASVTDFFDGYLARQWGAESTLGKLLDPMADKLLVAVMLLFLLNEGGLTPPSLTLTPAATRLAYGYASLSSTLFLPIVVILLRELYVAGLREFLALRNIPLPVSQSGKWKTATQMLAITLLLFAQGYGHPAAALLGSILLAVAAILAFTSAADYTRKSWGHLK